MNLGLGNDRLAAADGCVTGEFLFYKFYIQAGESLATILDLNGGPIAADQRLSITNKIVSHIQLVGTEPRLG